MVAVTFVQKGAGWLTQNMPGPQLEPPVPPEADVIAARQEETDATGKHPLWEGYKDVANYPASHDMRRRAGQVRTTDGFGRIYAWLVERRQAKAVVEFGAAFGVSGMWWLSGLNRSPGGMLYSFEPNTVWADFADENMRAISSNYRLTRDTFESAADAVLEPKSVDIGFIDAIHTSEFVFSQLAILKEFMRPGGLVLLDDIGFSDDMRACWETVSRDPEYLATATLSTRVGVIELR